ncbi:hypothetical protein KL918_003210 [Ogataea parapolymorpha]|nr:hypothetical protein KL918_003210 [Ogataea parapolymorpha]KAG7872379.1 hypothetical protein KL916_003114 [Ogataea parapolymorpha]KAG7882737.1 hypothetical protein KL938_003160 [Ogataea parapolymorpha]
MFGRAGVCTRSRVGLSTLKFFPTSSNFLTSTVYWAGRNGLRRCIVLPETGLDSIAGLPHPLSGFWGQEHGPAEYSGRRIIESVSPVDDS